MDMTHPALFLLVLAVIATCGIIVTGFILAPVIRFVLRVTFWVSLALIGAFLAGCAAGSGLPPGAIMAPPLVTYSATFEHQAAAELRHCTSPRLCTMVTDYLKLRCSIRWAKSCSILEPQIRPPSR